LYAEGRHSKAPTAELVLKAFQGHRCYRLLDNNDCEVLRFHDPVSDAADTLLTLLSIDRSAYGLSYVIQNGACRPSNLRCNTSLPFVDLLMKTIIGR
jgi:hypothetical protein